MTAHNLALRSLRYRAGGYVASFLTLLLGATILMTFASLLDISADPETETTLTIMASVVGGWGLLIVAFATVSTLTLLVRQRGAEMALLKSVGATPGQIGRMLVGEAAILAVLAVSTAIIPSVFTGRLLVGLLRDGKRIPAGITAAFGPVAIGVGLGVTLAAATFAATLAARRASRSTAREAMLAASAGTPRTGKVRAIIGIVMLAGGLSCGVLTMTVLDDSAEALMAVGGQASILCAIGLALLGPAIINTVRAIVAAPLRRAGASGYLTALNLRGQTHQLATALAPIILFTAIATGTLYMQAIENSARTPMTTDAAMAKTIETLNYVVVGMIALFAAVMLINTLIATTLRRRREFGQLRLAGSTRPQVLRMVGTEATVLASTGVLCGSLAATTTVIPYSVAKTGSVLPGTTITTYLWIVIIAAALTLAASLATARHTIHPPAIQALTD